MSVGVRVRPATPGDADAVTALVAEFFAAEGFATDAAVVRERVPRFLATGANAAFLAFEGDVPVGVATLTTAFGLETGHYAEIEDLYVVPDHRGRGVARRLLDACVAECERRGCADVEIVVTPAGEAAYGLRAFYGALGWVDTGRVILERQLGGSQSSNGMPKVST